MSTLKWLNGQGADSDVTVSTRVRFARNLCGYPFPGRMSAQQSSEVLKKVSEALLSQYPDYTFIELTDQNRAEAAAMAERHLISPEFAGAQNPRGVVFSPDESVSVMLNEEDHLRIQVLGAGLCPDQCLKKAEQLDAVLDQALSYAFNEKLGFLTSCPTNLGTGMRLSVMLHLPALSRAGALRELMASAGKLGFAVRGLYGEGSEATGALYQISNQFTLGFSEKQTVERMKSAAEQIIRQERLARAEMKKRAALFEDKAWRAYGILSSARLMSSAEAANLLSDLRLGSAEGVISSITPGQIDRLLVDIQPQTLALTMRDAKSSPHRDAARAKLIREALGGK